MHISIGGRSATANETDHRDFAIDWNASTPSELSIRWIVILYESLLKQFSILRLQCRIFVLEVNFPSFSYRRFSQIVVLQFQNIVSIFCGDGNRGII